MRSGKSRFAQRLATESGLPVTYIATATADDAEMKQRIETHKKSRPSHWSIIEEPLFLASALKTGELPRCILVECLTLWLVNCLTHQDEALFLREKEAFIAAVSNFENDLIVVSNETNMGVIPLGKLSRQYCDEAGSIHQQLASHFDRVFLVIAGLPQILKGDSLCP